MPAIVVGYGRPYLKGWDFTGHRPPAIDHCLSESGRRLKLLGNRILETAVEGRIERHAQFAVVIVGQGNEAKRLQTSPPKLEGRVQHFGHTVDGAGSREEGDFDEISGGKLVLQLKQTAVEGNGLEFCPRPLAAISHYRGRYRSMELYAGGPLVGIGLGEVGHSR
jgi:hypothetical protein